MFVSAVLLAAGSSSRFGSPKLLAEVGGEPILRRVTGAFCNAGFDDVLVVLQKGKGDGLLRLLRGVIRDLQGPVRFVENPEWRNGMFTSVKAGLRELDSRSTHVAVSPADLPFLGEDALRTELHAAVSLDERTLLVPTHEGRRGHPLLFSVSLVSRILSWPDDRRLSLLLAEPDLSVLHLEGFDDGIFRDVDRPEDLPVPSLPKKSAVTS